MSTTYNSVLEQGLRNLLWRSLVSMGRTFPIVHRCLHSLTSCLDGSTSLKGWQQTGDSCLRSLLVQVQIFRRWGPSYGGHASRKRVVISSNSLLFASTEAPDELGLKCRHVCFHVARKQALYEFPTTESGDAMALDSQGAPSPIYLTLRYLN